MVNPWAQTNVKQTNGSRGLEGRTEGRRVGGGGGRCGGGAGGLAVGGKWGWQQQQNRLASCQQTWCQCFVTGTHCCSALSLGRDDPAGRINSHYIN